MRHNAILVINTILYFNGEVLNNPSDGREKK